MICKVDGNKAKRVALNKPEGKRDAANSAAGASTKEGQKETETDVKEPAATEPSPASTSAKGPADASSAATSDAKAHFKGWLGRLGRVDKLEPQATR